MYKVTQRARGVKDDSPEGLFEVLGYAKGKKVSVITPEPMDFRGAVAMAAGFNEKPSGITAVVVPVTAEKPAKPTTTLLAKGDRELQINRSRAAFVTKAFKDQLAIINQHQDNIVNVQAIGVVAASLQRIGEIVESLADFNKGFDLESTEGYYTALESELGLSDWARTVRESKAKRKPHAFELEAAKSNFCKEFRRWISWAGDEVTTPFEAMLLARAIKVHAIDCVKQATGIGELHVEQTFDEILEGDFVGHDDKLNALFGLEQHDKADAAEASQVALDEKVPA